MKLKLDRTNVIDLMLACTYCSQMFSEPSKWTKLHDVLEDQVADFDLKTKSAAMYGKTGGYHNET